MCLALEAYADGGVLIGLQRKKAMELAAKTMMVSTQCVLCLYAHTYVHIRGVTIIGIANISATDMLIFTVSVISRDDQRSRYKSQCSASEVNFYLMYAKELIATRSF